MTRRARAASVAPVSMALVALSALALTGCVAKADLAEAIAVDITDDACAVATPTAKAGAVTFTLTNNGSDVNEFEILADDQLRIVGEKENVTPGQKVDFTAQLEPGTYYTACKFQQVGAPVGLAEFTVTGEASAVSADEQQLSDQAVEEYLAYVRSQAGELLPLVQQLADAYAAGDDETARALFAQARVPYERIEPTAEAFGDLDPKIDFREVDAVADGLDWTGFHRIEKDLWVPAADALNADGETPAWQEWVPSTETERAAFGDQLIADVQELYDYVHSADFQDSLDAQGIAGISNGAIALLDEVATGKIQGEEDWWSGTDLSDFAANVEGSKMAFSLVRDFAVSQGDEGAALADEIDGGYADLEAALARYGSLEDGFVVYTELTVDDKRELTDLLNSLAEPLSQLTVTVLA
jgi:iron uptake system component EfeO